MSDAEIAKQGRVFTGDGRRYRTEVDHQRPTAKRIRHTLAGEHITDGLAIGQ